MNSWQHEGRWEESELENRPRLECARSCGVELRPGDQVRLRPQGRADIMDMALAGKLATITSIEQDYEDNIHFAVVVDDDPGRDLGVLKQVGHRFFFAPDEVEPVRHGAIRPDDAAKEDRT